MKRNKKLGQAIIEYVLLLAIPILVISVLPELNKTVELTLNTVGVDLLEDEMTANPEQRTPISTCDSHPEICKVLYPPVARMELPYECSNGSSSTKGVYRKGSTIRIQDLSYDTDPSDSTGSYSTNPQNNSTGGVIDHTEWTVEKYRPDGTKVDACSTTSNSSSTETKIKVSRSYGMNSENTGLTIDMNGYGGLTKYANCVRDPGIFKVTVRAYDNDGLLSPNTDEKYFIIMDIRPSISVSATVATDAMPNGSLQRVTASKLSNRCEFEHFGGDEFGNITIENMSSNSEASMVEEIKSNSDDVFFYPDGSAHERPYYYTEVCPKSETSSGKVTFEISRYAMSSDAYSGTYEDNFSLDDPDFAATNGNVPSVNGDESIPEGSEKPLYGYNRYGFHYRSRFIQSSALEPDAITSGNSQAIFFSDGATEYVKEFQNPGLYLFDAQVIDENRITATTNTLVTPNLTNNSSYKQGENYIPDIGIAVKVLQPDDDRCNKSTENKSIICPKPVYLMGITKTSSTNETVIGPYYFSLGTVPALDESYINQFRDENNQSITSKYYSNTSSTDANHKLNKLENDLNMKIVTYSYGGSSVQIPVFRPTTDEHLAIKSLVYHPTGTGSYNTKVECTDAVASRYWYSSQHVTNDFNPTTLKSGTSAKWNAGNGPDDPWFEIHRPYDEDGDTLYYNLENIEKLDRGFNLTIDGEAVQHVELLFGMARNLFAEDDGVFGSDIIASPFNGGINCESCSNKKTEPYGQAGETNMLAYPSKKYESDNAYYAGSYLRSNGQLIAIAPKAQSCPLHEQRPIPAFSYISNSNNIVDISSSTKGIVYGTSDITWTIDPKNPPEGMTCNENGCIVSITGSASVCGPSATNCSIKAVRWKFSPYTHEPSNYETIEDANDHEVEFISQNSSLITYFPLHKNPDAYNNTPLKYRKYENILYPLSADPPHAYSDVGETTLDDTYDSMFSLPVNSNSSGTYIYYGQYGSAEEISDSIAEKMSGIPTFDYLAKTSDVSTQDLVGYGTVAPNGNQVLGPEEHPNITDGNSAYGVFLDAGGTYTYELEVIDSQGCATSRKITISIVDKAKDPVAFCNFVENTVSPSQLASYSYYGGLVVQGIDSNGNMKMFYNGDQISTPGSTTYKLLTSPLYMYASPHPSLDIFVGPNETNTYAAFLNGETAVDVPTQTAIMDGVYNPRVGQIPTNTTSLDGILNADYSLISPTSTPEESRTSINNVVWKVFKAEITVDASNGYDIVEIEGEDVSGVVLAKSDETPIATATTNNVTSYPNFPDGTFSEAGYYIIEMTVSYNNAGETLTSSPATCKMKVTNPVLDFKCPWGETYDELNESPLQLTEQIVGTAKMLRSSDDILSATTHVLTDSNNYNNAIDGLEFTLEISKDANNLDLIEKDRYGNVPYLDFSPATLNGYWQDLLTHGISLMHVCYPDSCSNGTNIWDAINPYTEIENTLKTSSTLGGTIQPLTLGTETLPMQAWLIRDRMTRMEDFSQSFAYLEGLDSSGNPALTDAQKALVYTPMNSTQLAAFKALKDELSLLNDSPLYDLNDLENILFKKLSYSYQDKFTFLDMQAPKITYFRTSGNNSFTYQQYTGFENFDSNTCVASEYSIRRCNNEFSRAFGTYVSTFETSITTPFFGKFLAAKRFEDLNYSDTINNASNVKNEKNPLTFDNSKYRYYIFDSDNYYIDPRSVRLNQIGLIKNPNHYTDNTTGFKSVSEITNGESQSGLNFANLPETLDLNSSVYNNGRLLSANLDLNTYNNISTIHGMKLGRINNTDGTLNNTGSITYIRVNAIDYDNVIGTKSDGSAIYNNYSKLCPIKVEVVHTHGDVNNACNLSYIAPATSGSSAIPYTPDKRDGTLKDSDGHYVLNRIADYLPEEYLNSNPIILSSEWATTAASNSFLPTSRVYKTASEYNASDIFFDEGVTREFIRNNLYAGLDMAEYKFYIGSYTNSMYLLHTINITYDLSFIPESVFASDTAINNFINEKTIDVMQQFKNQYYKDDSGKTYISDKIRDHAPVTDDTSQVHWYYDTLTYTVDLYYNTGTLDSPVFEPFSGSQRSRNCAMFMAFERPIQNVTRSPYYQEIGEWDYRIQYPNGSMIHWDRTYDKNRWDTVDNYCNSGNSSCRENYLLTPANGFSSKCMWKIRSTNDRPLTGLHSSKTGATSIGKKDDGETDKTMKDYAGSAWLPTTDYVSNNTRYLTGDDCRVAKSKNAATSSSPVILVGERRAREQNVLTEYSLYDYSQDPNTVYGFYWVDLFITPKDNADVSDFADCFHGKVTWELNENWCRKGTMYALTSKSNEIPGLTAAQVIEFIMEDNNTWNAGLYNAQKERTSCYGQSSCNNH